MLLWSRQFRNRKQATIRLCQNSMLRCFVNMDESYSIKINKYHAWINRTISISGQLMRNILKCFNFRSNGRSPRLFWVSSTTSTSTTTSTLSTNSLCFVTGTSAITANCKRKRRFIDFDPLTNDEEESEIHASSTRQDK